MADTCPHVVTDGTTSHCGLAEAEVARLQDEWQDAEGELRLRIRAQAAVIKRFKDGWKLGSATSSGRPMWSKLAAGPDGETAIALIAMSADEKRVIYGPPVTEGATGG